ncbi:MAG TPA: GNAT family N-acetyltransferase [Polyangia bacterium]|nr:GNAT family N-acetyltransferase [Polyangia bacterium]
MEIRPLLPSDDRSGFSSGELSLDEYFRRYAGQNQFKHNLGVTYVAVEQSRVLGYATVSAAHVEIDRLPPPLRKRFPAYPAPVLRLSRLATDQSARGRGVGTELLAYVVALATRMAREVGCVGILVDAKANAVDFYERRGFLPMELLHGETSEAPSPRPMMLPLKRRGAVV